MVPHTFYSLQKYLFLTIILFVTSCDFSFFGTTNGSLSSGLSGFFSSSSTVRTAVKFTSQINEAFGEAKLSLEGTCPEGLSVNFTGDLVEDKELKCETGVFNVDVQLTTNTYGDKVVDAWVNDSGFLSRDKMTIVYKETPTDQTLTIESPTNNSMISAPMLFVSGKCFGGKALSISGDLSQNYDLVCSGSTLRYRQEVRVSDGAGRKTITVEQSEEGQSLSRTVVYTSPAAPDMNMAAGIFQSKCIQCHSNDNINTSSGEAFGNSILAWNSSTSSGFEGRPMVARGNPDQSLIYLSLNSTDSPNSENFPQYKKMPMGVPTPDQDMINMATAMKAWIQSLTPVTAEKLEILSPSENMNLTTDSVLVTGSCFKGIEVSITGDVVSPVTAPCSQMSSFRAEVKLAGGNPGASVARRITANQQGKTAFNRQVRLSLPPMQGNEFNQMWSIFDAKCLGCHMDIKNNADSFINQGWAVAKKPESSKLITALKGNNNPYPVKADMPLSGAALSNQEVSAFIAFINSLDEQTGAIVTYNKETLREGSTIDLGTAIIGSSGSKVKVEIENKSQRTISIGQVQGANSGFSVTKNPTSSLSSNAKTDFIISFIPSSKNQSTSSININIDGKQMSFNLKGNGNDLLAVNGINCQPGVQKSSIDYIKVFEKNVMIANLRMILGSASNVLNESSLKPLLSGYPLTNNSDYLKSLDGGLVKEITTSAWEISYKISEIISNSSGYLTSFLTDLGSCRGINSTSGMNKACLTEIVQKRGRLAFSRSLNGEEQADYNKTIDYFLASGSPVDAFRSVITGLITDPYFMFIIDRGDQLIDSSKKIYSRSKAGLLRKMSLAILGQIPDETAISMAEAGKLSNKAGFEEVVAYLSNKSNSGENFTQAEVRMFTYFNDYFEIQRNSGPSKDASVVNGLLKSYSNAGVNTSQTHKGSFQEDGVHSDFNLLWTLLVDDDANASDFLLSNKIITPNPLFARTQKTNKVDQYQQTTGEKNSGMLLSYNLKFIKNGKGREPFHIGKWLAAKVACVDVPAPDPTQLPPGSLSSPNVDGTRPSREVYEEKTSAGACKSCHNVINPLGFAYEEFNAFGEKVDTQVFYDDAGNFLSEFDINKEVSATLHGQSFYASGSSDFMSQLVSAGIPQFCIAKHMAQEISKTQKVEGCFVKNSFESLVQGKPVKDLARSMIKWDSPIRYVKFE